MVDRPRKRIKVTPVDQEHILVSDSYLHCVNFVKKKNKKISCLHSNITHFKILFSDIHK